jgi:hypothetical protein
MLPCITWFLEGAMKSRRHSASLPTAGGTRKSSRLSHPFSCVVHHVDSVATDARWIGWRGSDVRAHYLDSAGSGKIETSL